MSSYKVQGNWVIVTSFIVAYYLSILPFPLWAEWWRPEWVALVLIYWVYALPHRIGVLTGWVVGLLLDVLEGVALGQNALSFTLLAYLTYQLHRRTRVFPIWQQSLVILVLIGLNLVVVRLIQTSISFVPNTLWYWFPCVVSALLWPWVFSVLRLCQRFFQVI